MQYKNRLSAFLLIFFSLSYFSIAHATTDSIQKTSINRFIVFGDSLSDTGNLLENTYHTMPSVKNYWEGRFTDGFTWVDYLAASYKTTSFDHNFIINNSIGGATAYPYSKRAKDDLFANIFHIEPNLFPAKVQISFISNLETEISNFKESNVFKDSDLVLIWIGSNDLLWIANDYDPNITDTTITNNALTYVKEGIENLIKSGVRNIILAGIPDFDLTPRFFENPSKGALVKAFNDSLRSYVEEVKVQNTVNIYFAETDSYFKNEILPNYQKYGFSDYNVRSFVGSTFDASPLTFYKYLDYSIYSNADDLHVFWDDVHPSSKTHSIIAALLQTNIIDPNFNINPPDNNCDYVEIENSGTYLLGISVNKSQHNNSCYSGDKTLVKGQRALISVNRGENLNLQAILGRNTTISLPKEIPLNYQSYLGTDVKTLIPNLQKIRCTGTTIIAFSCGIVNSLN